MEIEVKRTYNVNTCEDCPYTHKETDTSCCIDSFDEPNYDFYCKHEDADNSGREGAMYNNPKFGKYITTHLSRFDKCEIPEWCPFMKKVQQ